MSSSLGGVGRCRHSKAHDRKEKSRSTAAHKPYNPHKEHQSWSRKGTITKGAYHIGPGEVGPDLMRRIYEDEDLRKTLRNACHELSDQLGDAEIEAFVERDNEDPSRSRVVLEVSTSVESIDDYKRIKEIVRSTVREAEGEDTMVYTRISRNA